MARPEYERMRGEGWKMVLYRTDSGIISEFLCTRRFTTTDTLSSSVTTTAEAAEWFVVADA
jgi:hypothetical protein